MKKKESGSALLIATMISVILTLLGLAFLTIADQENSIAVNQRDSDQLLFVAEGGAQMVKAWFDRPVQGDPNAPIFKFMGDYDIRFKGYYDFTKRVYDHDGDPNTAPVLASATDPNKPLFRQGMLVSADPNYLSMWDKPYRGSKTAEFRGLESGPDVQMISDSTGLDTLDVFNQRIVGDKAAQERVGRIQQIDVYAPPIIKVNGVDTRYGICTVKITASKFKRMGNLGIIPVLNSSSVEVSRRVVKMVLNETPYPGPTGPFTSCVDFNINGNVQIHWGEIAVDANSSVGPAATLVSRTARTVPWGSANRYIDPNLLSAWVTANNAQGGAASFDPWFKLRAGGLINGAPNTTDQQLYSYVPITTTANDQTALFQLSPPQCPGFDYQIWKNVAVSGGQNIHYMAHTGGATADTWQEDGVGTAQGVEAWTNNQEGFWFFDTTDRQPPSGTSNITPVVTFSGNWSSSGFIYLNANWDSAGTGGGHSAVLIPPGEPWNDSNVDKVAGPNEFVNLRYPTSLAGGFTVYTPGNASNPAQTATVTSTNGVTYKYTTDPNGRDTQGLPFTDNVHFQGVIFIQGTLNMTGNMVVFGAMETKGGMVSTSAGTPDIYFDERLIKGQWPPPELNLPRTTISYWQTEM